MAHLDVSASMADLALSLGLSRPIILPDTVEQSTANPSSFPEKQTPGLYIKNGRHIVVAGVDGLNFTPNDCVMTNEKRLWLLTGSNMAGKVYYTMY